MAKEPLAENMRTLTSLLAIFNFFQRSQYCTHMHGQILDLVCDTSIANFVSSWSSPYSYHFFCFSPDLVSNQLKSNISRHLKDMYFLLYQNEAFKYTKRMLRNQKKMNAKEKYVLQGIQIFEFIRSNIFQTNAGDMYATHSE